MVASNSFNSLMPVVREVSDYLPNTSPPGAPHRYFLELVEGERDFHYHGVIELPYVTNIAAKYYPASVNTFTVNSFYEEHEGFRKRSYRLAGRSGHRPADIAHFKQVLHFIETLQKNKRDHMSAFARSGNVQLILTAPFEGVSFLCNLDDFTWERDRGRASYSYVWSIAVTAFSYISEVWNNPTAREQRWAYIQDEWKRTDLLGDAYTTRTRDEIRQTATWYGLEVEPLLPATLRGATPSFAMAAATGMSQLSKAEDDVFNFYNAYSWWGDLPIDKLTLGHDLLLYFGGLIYDGMALALGMYARSQAPVPDTIKYLYSKMTSRDFGEIESAARALHEQALAVGDAAGATLRYLTGTDEVTNRLNVTRNTPTTTAQVIVSDHTVIDVATRVTGSADNAEIIAILNGLRDFRTWGNGAPLAPGDTLIVPLNTGPIVPRGTDVLGIDWLIKDYDLVLNDDGDDIVSIAGIDAYMQNTKHRLMTERGSNPVFKTTGIVFAGTDRPKDLTAARMAVEVRTQVLLDPRTKRVVSIDARETDNSIDVDIVFEPVASSPRALSFSYTG